MRDTLYNHDQVVTRPKSLIVGLSHHLVMVYSTQLLTVLGVILANDFPTKYPGYLAQVQTLLQSQDPKTVFIGLLALKETTRVYKYRNLVVQASARFGSVVFVTLTLLIELQ